MISLEPHAEGAILPVQAHAGARRDELRQPIDGMLRVGVAQAPEKGKANKAIIALLAKQLSLRKSQFELLSGATSRQKRFLVRDVAPAELATRIEQALGKIQN
ncbi:MAG: DUF167 domain-containing protein [Pirellulales bacterium]|nr:DUF167 domain-containing protein [Pirellulales bacterium]